ncbi:MAG: carbohydrate ABC transporter permease [Clostridia bacterium]|nr:carbohydrate ABC transporter permease [Clostridia bacterium]
MQFCSCMVAAYGLSRFKLKGKSIMMALLILNILVPTMMIITPSYVNFSRMDFFGILGLISKVVGTDIRPNLIGTPLVFHLPSLLAVGLKGGLFIYIFMQFFKGLPRELEEAAWIDGAGPWKTFLRIVIPSSGAASVTVLLFSIVWHWNDYYLAQMYMEDKTLASSLNSYSAVLAISKLGLDTTMAGVSSIQLVTAGCLIFVLPLLIFYLFMQKKFINSIATSGIVG